MAQIFYSISFFSVTRLFAWMSCVSRDFFFFWWKKHKNKNREANTLKETCIWISSCIRFGYVVNLCLYSFCHVASCIANREFIFICVFKLERQLTASKSECSPNNGCSTIKIISENKLLVILFSIAVSNCAAVGIALKWNVVCRSSDRIFRQLVHWIGFHESHIFVVVVCCVAVVMPWWLVLLFPIEISMEKEAKTHIVKWKHKTIRRKWFTKYRNFTKY